MIACAIGRSPGGRGAKGEYSLCYEYVTMGLGRGRLVYSVREMIC